MGQGAGPADGWGLRLNLGCGHKPIAGFVNVDQAVLPGVDVGLNLDNSYWPWDENSVDEIRAFHVFEHLENPVGFMSQCHYILKPGGLLWIVSPHYLNMSAFTDPTHKRFCTEHTWDYWIKGTPYADESVYGDCFFTSGEIKLDAYRVNLHARLVK